MLKEIEELEIALAKAKAKYKSSQTTYTIKPEFEAFEVYSKDLEGRFAWTEAKEACAKLGTGWRLPTKEELNEMYKKRDDIGGFASDHYWSSTEDGNYYAWIQSFYYGLQLYGNYEANYDYYVRAVRDLTI